MIHCRASSKNTINYFYPMFKSVNSSLITLNGNGNGLTAARNLGVRSCKSDAIFFLDDDTWLYPSTLQKLAIFLDANPCALGVQFLVVNPKWKHHIRTAGKLRNALFKVLGQDYYEINNQSVDKSTRNVLPTALTKVISAQHLGGCSCYRTKVFRYMRFDTNLKRWAFKEDLDFSYRVYKKWPGALWVIPSPRLIHTPSEGARLPTKLKVRMEIVYTSYIFFKDFFDSSARNLAEFLWSSTGRIGLDICNLVLTGKKRKQSGLISSLSNYCLFRFSKKSQKYSIRQPRFFLIKHCNSSTQYINNSTGINFYDQGS